jgi:hypothetical protein
MENKRRLLYWQEQDILFIRVADAPIVDIGKEVGLCFSEIYDGLVIRRGLVV